MKRHVVAGLLGLAIAGCAQDGILQKRLSQLTAPVGLTPPMDSIHQQIKKETAQLDVGRTQADPPRGTNGATSLQAASATARPDSSASSMESSTRTETPASDRPLIQIAPEPQKTASVPSQPAPPASDASAAPMAALPAVAALPAPVDMGAPATNPADTTAQPKPDADQTASPATTTAPSTKPADTSSQPMPVADPATSPAATTPPASAGASTARSEKPLPALPADDEPALDAKPRGPDPLLGPNPDVMPEFNTLQKPPPKEIAPAIETNAPALKPTTIPNESSAGMPTSTTRSADDDVGPARDAKMPAPVFLPGPVAEPLEPTPAGEQPAPLTPTTSASGSLRQVVELPIAGPASSPSRSAAQAPATLPDATPATGGPAKPTEATAVPLTIIPPPTSGAASDPSASSTNGAGTATKTASVGPDPLLSRLPDVVSTSKPSTTADATLPKASSDVAGAPPAASTATAGSASPVSLPPVVTLPTASTPSASPSDTLPAITLPEIARPSADAPAAPAATSSAETKTAPSAGAPAPLPAPTSAVSPKAPKAVDPADEPVVLPSLSAPESAAPGQAAAPENDAALIASKIETHESIRDPEVKQAVGDPSAIHSEMPTRTIFEAGKAVARVGDEIITRRDLDLAVNERGRKAYGPNWVMPDDERSMIELSVLDNLIDRSVVTQEAKRMVKDPKALKLMMEECDKYWEKDELPPLLRKTHSTNIHELKTKMAATGESLEDTRDLYRKDFLFQIFLSQKLMPKLKPDLPEMHNFYTEHLKDFDAPAQVTWREVVFDVRKAPSREEAKRRAEAALKRIRAGESIAAVANEVSNGPNRSAGGLWKLTPGSYRVAAVNAALEKLAVGDVSSVIEGPMTYHIVSVEARREAGPETFAHVQDEIIKRLKIEKNQRESVALLDSLRSKVVIVNYLRPTEQPKGVPTNLARAAAPVAN